MKKNFHLYLGKAGHLHAMSEFLMRGWNVAIPEVDIGDDIFVVQDDSGLLKRVQVKTSTAKERKNGFSGQFNLSATQLNDLRAEYPIYYVFIVRHKGTWTKPLILIQNLLLAYYDAGKIGAEHKGNLTLYFSYNEDKVTCSGINLTKYIADFTDFPITTDSI